MQVVLNKRFGGFGISDDAAEILGFENPVEEDIIRYSSELIDLIQKRGSEFCSSYFAKLVVVTIPDSNTDFVIKEYDGYETIIYVVNGKLHFA